MRVSAVAILAFLAVADAQFITWFGDSCPRVPTKENFDIVPYMGRWYELSKYPNSFQNGECGTAFYRLEADGTVTVNNTQIKADGSSDSAIGQARDDPDSDVPGRLQVRFSSFQPWGSYWVVDTDYTNYSIVYSCDYFLINRVEFLWILARDRALPAGTMSNIMQKLESYNIDTTKLVDTVQDIGICEK
ncbi:PREDICTED: apolipoprotein D-like [Branchiostoma belcheri]|uniref:Apolipoprotein D n=1 Tax=Branchiostoma belcheri TaxID=7741 RepID=A0A6P4YPE5_BRABE|nr:PREDICTED: apolipoprotein D-like [Branchiostoma belcheri]